MDGTNQALVDWCGEYGLPQFERIADEDYEPAFHAALAAHAAEIETIAGNAAPPDFANMIVALERCGKPLTRISALFWNRAGADTNDVIRTVERSISPVLSRHYSRIAQDRRLFERIDTLWSRRDELALDTESAKVLEKHWKGLVRSGARLDDEGQKRLADINERLSVLGTEFGQNVLADEAEWVLPLTMDDLDGLPDDLISAMAAAAQERDSPASHVVTLSRSIIEPFLTCSNRRDLRERAFRAWIARGENERDNWAVIREVLQLRAEKAGLLGYDSYACYKLDDTMAKSPQAVAGLLEPVWEKAVIRAGEEAAALAELIAREGNNHDLEPWDWRHYAEKLRGEKYDLSASEIKAHFHLDRMIEAAFDVAGRLFGIRFRARPDIVAWHPDVRVFEMRDGEGSLVGVFFGDYFARPSKRSGAWMGALQSAHGLDGGEKPFIYNIMNFARPAAGRPALLSLDDARTLFHEFGHALHGLLSRVTYPSISGTSVARDFVELPSQLFEHWMTVPEILRRYAVHHETGAPLPDATIERIKAAEKFNTGFQTVEFTASALVDMAYHTGEAPQDPAAFERELLERIAMPEQIAMRHRSPHFLHVFAGDGYSAGYYAYLWSEVLDADAFRAFEEAGNPFDPEIAARLREHIYASGGSIDPEDAYRAFRGQLPSPQAMLEGRGLA